MKRTVLALLLALPFVVGAQTPACVPDSTVLMDSLLISPQPWTPANPIVETAPACINEFYYQVFTFNVPPSITTPNGTYQLDSVRINTGANPPITNLPTGITYGCNPPSCSFAKNKLGCLVLSGLVSPINVTGLREITINGQVFTTLLPGFAINLVLPGGIQPDAKYFIDVRPQGQCMVGASDLSDRISDFRVSPNPTSGLTQISLETSENADYRFEVFDVLGRQVHRQRVSVFAGANQFFFDASTLSPGTYVCLLANENGRIVRSLIVGQ